MSHLKKVSVAKATHCAVNDDNSNLEQVRLALNTDPLGCLIEIFKPDKVGGILSGL